MLLPGGNEVLWASTCAAQCHPRTAWLAGVRRASLAGGRRGRLHVLWWCAHFNNSGLGYVVGPYKGFWGNIWVFLKGQSRGKAEVVILDGAISHLAAILI